MIALVSGAQWVRVAASVGDIHDDEADRGHVVVCANTADASQARVQVSRIEEASFSALLEIRSVVEITAA